VKLWFHILRELLVGFAFTFGGTMVLALPAIAVSALHKLGGADMLAVLIYMPLVLSGLIPYVLPVAFLLAVVSTYGRLAADNEWTAIRMAGWHPLWMFTPGLVLASGLGALTLWMVGDVLPEIRRRQAGYMFEVGRQELKHLNPGRTTLEFDEFYLNASRRDGDAFLNAIVYIPAIGDQPARHISAERVEFRFDEDSVFVMCKNARSVVGDLVATSDPTFEFNIAALQQQEQKRYKALRYRDTSQIRAELREGPETPERANDLRYELHARRSLASIFFVFLLLGAPTGLFLRRGTQLGALAMAVGYALVYYLLHMRLTRQLADAGVLPPEFAAWAMIVVGLVAGAWLTFKAVRQ
jgi:lipopolysaccharide export LptBFGC system permease protein LptF